MKQLVDLGDDDHNNGSGNDDDDAGNGYHDENYAGELWSRVVVCFLFGFFHRFLVLSLVVQGDFALEFVENSDFVLRYLSCQVVKKLSEGQRGFEVFLFVPLPM